ncbi:hypothetical protein MMYC01_203692 [Madurella mycetomatis]|uniref:Uncharacterized protein n=1 Tax=Madurella mycetomatis TaxID=100816 RepID=A0A175W6L7_9PEZI|nr:hypothetical protein MMYC01_203692 [Madurella mycetomatis]
MPPPHLHPRSRMTSSLFATTVVASFFVVALPHILPCPAPRRAYADGEMPHDLAAADGSARRKRRRRLEGEEVAENGIVQFTPGEGDGPTKAKAKAASKRECPVPKPGGVLGEWLGFNGNGGGRAVGEKRPER